MTHKGKWWEGWLIAITLGVFYFGVAGRIPVSYWDEMIWVGRSYFVDYYLKGDWNSPVWQTIASYDQPKLGEYMYGLWIYPKYLYEKLSGKTMAVDYPVYLINNGFYQINESSFGEYKEYLRKKMPQVAKFDPDENRDRNSYRQKYGDKAMPTFDLVVYARHINILWLVLSVVVAYEIIKTAVGKYWGIVGALIYGINSLVVTWGLKAHVEGMFLFFFNLSLWLIYKYCQKNDLKTLLLLSISIGLCTNAKLSGLMLWPIFAGACFVWGKKKIMWRQLVMDLIVMFLVTALLLVMLNPYLQGDAVGKFGVLFEKRAFSAKLQSEMFPEASLSTPFERIARMGSNFFFPRKVSLFNGIYGLKDESGMLSIALIISFVTGVAWTLREAYRGDKFQRFMLLVCMGIVVSMSSYLVLDWDRYYIQLVLPVIYFEIAGVKILTTVIFQWTVKYYKKLGLICGGVVMGLFLVEMYLQVISYPTQNCKVINESDEYTAGKFDKQNGWSYKEFVSVENGGVKYDFGEEGQRINKDVTRVFTKDTKNILVVGDSILFGHGISASETFSEKLQDKLGNRYRVMNFSVQGYGTDQIFLRIMKLIALYRPEIIITDYISDHNKRNVNEDRRYMFPCMKFSGTKPVFAVQNERLKQVSFPEEYSKFDRLKIGLVWRRFNEASKLKNWTYQEKLTRALMVAMNEIVNINKIKLLTINFDSEMTEYQKQESLPFVVEVNNQKDKTLYIGDGVHPNTKGTSVMLDKFWSKFGNDWF